MDMNKKERDSLVVRTSVTGIIANLVLAALKFIAGLMARSMAIQADAINNMSDAASSIVTIVGTKLAAKPADKKHPFGYGRMEYLSSLVIGTLVLFAGLHPLRDAVNAVFKHADLPDYSHITLMVVSGAVIVKILIGRLFVSTGKKTNSDALVNSGKDALFDSIISTSTLVGAAVYLLTGISVEPYVAAFISIFIIKAGIEMLLETVSKLLGESGDLEKAEAIKRTIMAFDGVDGAYDLVLNNYGPDEFSGSVHIAVPDTYSAWDIDDLIRDIQIKVAHEHKVILNAIGVYSINTKDPFYAEAEDKVISIVRQNEFVRQIHGFHMNKDRKTLRFDVVISFDAKDRVAVYDKILSEVRKAFPGYTVQMALDTDYFES